MSFIIWYVVFAFISVMLTFIGTKYSNSVKDAINSSSKKHAIPYNDVKRNLLIGSFIIWPVCLLIIFISTLYALLTWEPNKNKKYRKGKHNKVKRITITKTYKTTRGR